MVFFECRQNVLERVIVPSSFLKFKIFENTKINHLREFEIKVQKVCRNLQIKGLFHYDGEPKEGDHHYGSNVYPYVATAVVKGKWNISGYQDKLKNILVENNININLRGVV